LTQNQKKDKIIKKRFLQTLQKSAKKTLKWTSVDPTDYRCDIRCFRLSAHNCQVPTPTSQNLEVEQQIRIFGADQLINYLED
jgi:hypothetical protein